MNKILKMLKWVVWLTSFTVYTYIVLKKACEGLAAFLTFVLMPVIVLIAGHVLFAAFILNSFQGLFTNGNEYYKTVTKALTKVLAFFIAQKINADAKSLTSSQFIRKYLALFTPMVLSLYKPNLKPNP